MYWIKKVKQEVLKEVTDKFLDAAVEDLCSELKSNWQKVHNDIETLEGEKDELKNTVTKLGAEVNSLGSDVFGLKEQVEMKTSLSSNKIITVVNEPSPSPAKCKNCKKNPCLKGELVTLQNFVDGAYFRGNDGIKGYTKLQGFEWVLPEDKDSFFPFHIYARQNSIRYSC